MRFDSSHPSPLLSFYRAGHSLSSSLFISFLCVETSTLSTIFNNPAPFTLLHHNFHICRALFKCLAPNVAESFQFHVFHILMVDLCTVIPYYNTNAMPTTKHPTDMTVKPFFHHISLFCLAYLQPPFNFIH